MFIFIGVPFFYCVAAIPLVLLFMYIIIYGNVAMKAMETISSKRPLQSWVAEVYQPYFFARNPQNFTYKIIPEHRLEKEHIDTANYQRKVDAHFFLLCILFLKYFQVVGTVSVMNHKISNNSAWLFVWLLIRGYLYFTSFFALYLRSFILGIVKKELEKHQCKLYKILHDKKDMQMFIQLFPNVMRMLDNFLLVVGKLFFCISSILIFFNEHI